MNSSRNSEPDAWQIVFEGYDPADEGRREALFALGNGYFVTRAAAPEAVSDGVHYPGTYRAGIYNRLVSTIQGGGIQSQEVDNESLVNLPNWLPLTFRIDEGSWFSIDEVERLEYRQRLDLKGGVLHRELHFRDAQGRRTALHERRFVSMADPHLAGLSVELTAEDWSGEVEVRSALDGRVVNANVERYAPYSKRHLEPLGTGVLEPEGVWLKARTQQSCVEVALAARTRVRVGGDEVRSVREVYQERAYVAEHLRCRLEPGAPVVIEKVAALYTSRDPALSESSEAARGAVRRAADFNTSLEAHRQAWARLWRRCDIHLDGSGGVEGLRAVRLHTFHVLQTASPHTADLDVGIPARGLHGEAYRGHIFWDELFVFPFLIFRFPSTARSLLLYRYRRLDEARRMAREQGYRGAMFPWRSASNGREETPAFQLNLLSSHWMPDPTQRQRHVGAAIAFNLWHYAQATNDREFLYDYGAELLLEIARFWASLATYNPELGRFEILGVLGPDEYQTAYPGAAHPGVDNNTYTNLMAVWTLSRALEVWDGLPPRRRDELRHALTLSQEELEGWERVSRRMHIPFHDGVLSQFEGIERLQELDLERFYERHSDERLDWLLEAEGDSADNYTVSKQADVLTLFYLLSEGEVRGLLERLGYPFDHAAFRRTADYYLQRTAHQSSLSRVVYAGALTSLDPNASWRFFERSQFIDLLALKGESTAEGIHLGAMAGTLSVLQHHYLGLSVQRGTLCLEPSLPEALSLLCFGIHFRQNELELELSPYHLTVTSAVANLESVEVMCSGQERGLEPGESVTFELLLEKQ